MRPVSKNKFSSNWYCLGMDFSHKVNLFVSDPAWQPPAHGGCLEPWNRKLEDGEKESSDSSRREGAWSQNSDSGKTLTWYWTFDKCLSADTVPMHFGAYS